MPLIDIHCETCDQIAEVHRALSMYPATPPCPSCGAATVQIHLPKAVQWTPDPVIVYQAKDGSFRFPGDGGALSAHAYDKQGFTRIELRNATEVRRFEGVMNKHERARAERYVEAQQRQREIREKSSRSELFHKMRSMSNLGRDVARVAMARNDAKPGARASDANFHNDAYSFDRSNRQESRDSQGRRRRD